MICDSLSVQSLSGLAALLLHVKETDVRLNIHMANKKQKIKQKVKGEGKDKGGGCEKPSSLPSETVDLCDQAAWEASRKEQEKKVFFTHFFTWLHTFVTVSKTPWVLLTQPTACGIWSTFSSHHKRP